MHRSIITTFAAVYQFHNDYAFDCHRIGDARASSAIRRVFEARRYFVMAAVHSCDAPARTMSYKNDKDRNCNKIIAASSINYGLSCVCCRKKETIISDIATAAKVCEGFEKRNIFT